MPLNVSMTSNLYTTKDVDGTSHGLMSGNGLKELRKITKNFGQGSGSLSWKIEPIMYKTVLTT